MNEFRAKERTDMLSYGEVREVAMGSFLTRKLHSILRRMKKACFTRTCSPAFSLVFLISSFKSVFH